jgi:hypothetical protein
MSASANRATRAHQLQLGPEPHLTMLQAQFIHAALERGYHPIVCRAVAGVTVVAVRVETVRTVRQPVAVSTTESAPAGAGVK